MAATRHHAAGPGFPFRPGSGVPTATHDGSVPIVQGSGLVRLRADGSTEAVLCTLTAPARVAPPKPKFLTIDMPGAIGAVEYLGQDPYTLELDIRLDAAPDGSVEPSIRALEAFGETGGNPEPPVVIADGTIPLPHPNLKWRITDFGTPTVWTLPSGERCRYVTTLTLTQNVKAAALEESLHQTSASKGIKTRTTKVRPGEDLYAVARRFYGDPSRASDIARSNFQGGRPLRLGQTLKAGMTLRMPS